MSFYAFYDHTSAGRRGPALALVPAQVALRRVLRPAFHRLRDLLQLLSDRQQAQADVTGWVSDRVAVLEGVGAADRLAALETAYQYLAESHRQLTQTHQQLDRDHRQLAAAHRAVTADHLAAARRVVLLEDLILQAAADRAADAGSPWVVPMHQADTGRGIAARKAS